LHEVNAMRANDGFAGTVSSPISPDRLRWPTIMIIFACLLTGLILANSAYGQAKTDEKPAVTVDAAWKAAVIDSVLAALDHDYVYPEKAKAMNEHIRKLQKKGFFKDVTDPRTFTDTLTFALQEVCPDKHMGVRYLPDFDYSVFKPDSLKSDEEKQHELQENLKRGRYENFGFQKVERLAGNVGYLDFREFADARYAGATAIAAMNFLANCDALIIDLRQNGGGNASMIRLISSYFFDDHTHLTSWYYRPSDSIIQSWTDDYVVGKPMYDMDLYVLTSSYTFSAAEEFTYNLKNLKRATIIGETTGGGAHPVESFGFENLKVAMRVPFGRAINPVTGTNWEGVGITPDIEVPQEQALDRAQVEALKKIEDRTTDEQLKRSIAWLIDYKNAMMNPFNLSPELMSKYVGVYGPRAITLDDGKLYYQRVDRPKYEMIPMSKDTFIFKDLDYFRLRVDSDDNGNIVSVTGLYDNGRTDVSPKNTGQ
jgi:hypothetical protein